MGILSWWKGVLEKKDLNRQTVSIATDQDLIAAHVPELLGMSDVEQMAFILEQIQEWNRVSTADQARIFQARLKASSDSWDEMGLVMPPWGNLWILRSLQTELGLAVPWVSPSVNPSGDPAEIED